MPLEGGDLADTILATEDALTGGRFAEPMEESVPMEPGMVNILDFLLMLNPRDICCVKWFMPYSYHLLCDHFLNSTCCNQPGDDIRFFSMGRDVFARTHLP